MVLTYAIALLVEKTRRNREISIGIATVICAVILASSIFYMPKPSFESRTVVEVQR